jgi:hypothetical protein
MPNGRLFSRGHVNKFVLGGSMFVCNVSKTVDAWLVLSCLQPLQLYGRHRLNVEEKKEQSELFSRPRGGGRGRGTGSYRGSYRGGRGGQFTASTQSGGALSSGSQ